MGWDVAISKTLRADRSRFALDVAFRSDASRLVLFGPSGAGKSLTLRAMAGLLTPDDGHIRHDDRTLYDRATQCDLPPRARRLGLLAQDHALFPHLTARQNIASGLAPGRWWNPGRDTGGEAVDRWLDAFRLRDCADHHPAQLSGGQAQRVALARTLVAAPRALLLDEPFSALDAPLRDLLRRELLGLQQRLALPMVLITHDPADVDMLGEQVLRVEGGRVVG